VQNTICKQSSTVTVNEEDEANLMDFAQILAIVVGAILLVERAGLLWTVRSRVCGSDQPRLQQER
jgi:hypothetical protein